MDLLAIVVCFACGFTAGIFVSLLLDGQRKGPDVIDQGHDHVFGPWEDYLYDFQRRRCNVCGIVDERMIR